MNERIEKYLRICAYVSVLTVAFFFSLAKVDDYDVWWHLKCGELIVRDHWIARTDIFSITAQGRPWINGYGLAQIVMYLFEAIGGTTGVSIFGAIMITAIFAVAMIPAMKSRSATLAPIVSLAAIMLSRPTFLPRPALFTPLFALLAIYLLEDYSKKRGRKIFLLLPLSIIWANSHPAFPLIMVLTAIYAITNAIRPPEDSALSRRDSITLIALIAGEFVCTLVNPYGAGIYYSLREFAANDVLKQIIVEWRPLFSQPGMAWGVRAAFVVLCAIWLVSLVFSLRKSSLANIAVFLTVAAMTVMNRRNLFLFGVTAIPLIAWNLERSEKTEKHGRIITLFSTIIIVASLAFSFLVATNRFYRYVGEMYRSGVGPSEALLPIKAAEFLKREKITGNIFHPYAIGGYLIHELYPKYKVFMDGRVYPYPLDLFMKTEGAFSDIAQFDRLRREWNITAVIVPITIEQRWAFLMAMMESPYWACVAADGSAALFLLRGAGNDEIISRNEIKLLETPPTLTEMSGLPRAWKYPYGEMLWARIYERLERPDLALPLIEKALTYRPTVKGLSKWRALTLIAIGKNDEGCAALEEELKTNMQDVRALLASTDCAIGRRDYSVAEKLLSKAIELDPKQPTAWNTYGELALNNKLYRDAADRFRQAIALDRNNPLYWENLGTALYAIDRRESYTAFVKSLELYERSGAPVEETNRVKAKLEALR